jgi:hypothetical protein
LTGFAGFATFFGIGFDAGFAFFGAAFGGFTGFFTATAFFGDGFAAAFFAAGFNLLTTLDLFATLPPEVAFRIVVVDALLFARAIFTPQISVKPLIPCFLGWRTIPTGNRIRHCFRGFSAISSRCRGFE